MNHALAIELHIRFIKKEAQIVEVLYRETYPETLEDTGFTPIGLDEPYRIVVGNNPVNSIDPWGLAQDQSGKGPLTSDDPAIREAVKRARQNLEDAKNFLRKEIEALEKQLKDACLKNKKEILNRLKMLRAALKVLPRYFMLILTPFSPEEIDCIINPQQAKCGQNDT